MLKIEIDDALKGYFSERWRSVKDGDKYSGIATLEDAVCFTPLDHPARISWLNILEGLLNDCIQMIPLPQILTN